jgi:hypothetical protein
MRSRFALLIATAVVFAPGWYGQEAPEHPRGSDLAARVLAPTVDEGAIREIGADPKHQLSTRQSKRWRPSLSSAAIAAFGLGAIALLIFWAVACHRESQPPRLRLRHRLSRAPPRLQPA